MTLKTNKSKPKTKPLGFTIVELLVVIVIIGILAVITIVSYIGITKKANESTLQSDLATAKKQFALYYTEHGVYPTGLNENKCPTGTTNPSPDTNYCLKPSSGDDIEISEADGSKYKLTATKGTLVLTIADNSGLTANDPDWVTIGTQKWARKNLNVGTMVTGVTEQTNNSIVEKYCYNDNEASCTTYGGLYQWNEAMNWSVIESTQGICPAGSHIPSDNDWKILEVQIGMSQSSVDSEAWRDYSQIDQMRVGGNTGMNVLISGFRDSGGGFRDQVIFAGFWTSTKGAMPLHRIIQTNFAGYINRNTNFADRGFSIRCLIN